jgi:tetratricopeptide (TPR) repeat protein
MKARSIIVGKPLMLLLLTSAAVVPAVPQGREEMTAAIAARNSKDVETLRRLMSEAQRRAEQEKTAQGYQTVAQLHLWLCEIGHARNDDKLIKQAAEDGASAAEKAIALDPNSSEAHRLEGESLSQLIPHVFAGGPRLGPRSTRELDKAIELDPKNANAYIARAYNYFFTPKAFGGDKEKAAETLQKAIELDPNCDTAHVWLAQVYLVMGEKQNAVREINTALRLDPSRALTQYVHREIAGSGHAAASETSRAQ